MVVRSTAAPPTPWSTNLAQPTIHETAFVHSFSNIIGDVRIGPNVLIAPGTSIRADEGSPFYIGGGSNIQDGVVIHGLDQGRVVGDDQNQYSVWIGKHTSITHKALIHGPAYIGDDCFIGFRSTIFNARVGKGCIVMMHALVQDVEIPPGKFVPSGSVITTQQQADRLPDVEQEDMQFAHHVVGVNDALRTGYRCAEDVACITSFRNELAETGGSSASPGSNTGSTNGNGHYSQGSTQGSTMGLNTDILNHLRQILAGGYRIGTEHIDERRFRTNSWQSCSPLQARSESEAVRALESCLQEHQGEYVRLFGIEQKGRQRVLEAIIQRPGSKPQTLTRTSAGSAPGHAASSGGNAQGSATSASLDLVQQVRQLLNQGYRLGTEYANARQYKANAWKGGPNLQATRDLEAVAALEAFMAEHAGEYVRLIGIDPKAKRRVAEILIQQPNGKVLQTGGVKSAGTTPSSGSTSGGAVNGAIADQVQQLLNQGYRIGTEYANARQYKANAWKGGPNIQSTRPADVLAELQAFMADHAGEYVRLIGIEPKAKRRVVETLIQQPNGKSAPSAAAPTVAPAAASSNGSGSYNYSNSSPRLSSDVVQQIRQILNQGNRVGIEYANARHYKANAWKSGESFQTSQERDVIAGLEAFLAEHDGEYVRLLGIEPKAKRRVLELLIQQPNGK